MPSSKVDFRQRSNSSKNVVCNNRLRSVRSDSCTVSILSFDLEMYFKLFSESFTCMLLLLHYMLSY